MGYEKWELRYPLLLFLFLLASLASVQAATTAAPGEEGGDAGVTDAGSEGGTGVLCNNLAGAATACSQNGGYTVVQTMDDEICQNVQCFQETNNPLAYVEQEEENSAVMETKPEIPKGDGNVTITCSAWSRQKMRNLKLELPDELPSDLVTTLAVRLGSTSEVYYFAEVTWRFVLVKKLHGKKLACRMIMADFGASVKGENVELYYLKLKRPIITGPRAGEVLQKVTFTCTVDEATVDNLSFLRVDMNTNPTTSGEAKTTTKAITQDSPTIYKVTTSFEVQISTYLKPRFFVECTIYNTETRPNSEASADQFSVNALNTPIYLDSTFNVIGSVCGVGALLISVAMVVYYQRKKAEAEAAAAAPAPPAA